MWSQALPLPAVVQKGREHRGKCWTPRQYLLPVICILDGGQEESDISRARQSDQVSLSCLEHNTATEDLEELCQAALAHTS